MNTQNSNRKHFYRKGFTLVELMTTVIVLVILAGITTGGLTYFNRKAAEEKARTQIAVLGQGLEAFKADNGFYPPLVWNTSIHGTALQRSHGNLGIRTGRRGGNVYSYPVGTATVTNLKVFSDRSSKVVAWALGGQAISNSGIPSGRVYVPDLVDSESDPQGWFGFEDAITDPFGNPYGYRDAVDWAGSNSGQTINPDFDLWSAGVDGEVGKRRENEIPDDITNW